MCFTFRNYRDSFLLILLQASHFDAHHVSLPGCCKFFKKSSDEEFQHAQKLIDFQNKRGGKVVFTDLKKPAKDEWGTALDAMKAAQELERTVNQSLLDLHKLADSHNDYHVSESQYYLRCTHYYVCVLIMVANLLVCIFQVFCKLEPKV